MKTIRSFILAFTLCVSVSVHAFVDADWEIMTPITGVKVLIKSNDFGFKYEFPVVVGTIKGKITAKSVTKSVMSFAKNESEFIITQCMGEKLPTAYNWKDFAGSRIASIVAMFSSNASLKQDLHDFYTIKKQLSTVKNVESKKELLRQCVILKYDIKEKLKIKKRVVGEVSKKKTIV